MKLFQISNGVKQFNPENPALFAKERGNGASNEKSFTLVELLVSIFIIILMSGIIFANYRQSGQQFALQRSANKLAQDIRRAQQMAMGAKECAAPPASCPDGVPAGGYGVYINKSQDDRYFIYADSNTAPGKRSYTSGEEIEEIPLEEGVYIKDFIPSSANFSINFMPPDPTVDIKDAAGTDKNNVDIIIALRTDPSKIKIIKVNKAGLILVE